MDIQNRPSKFIASHFRFVGPYERLVPHDLINLDLLPPSECFYKAVLGSVDIELASRFNRTLSASLDGSYTSYRAYFARRNFIRTTLVYALAVGFIGSIVRPHIENTCGSSLLYALQ